MWGSNYPILSPLHIPISWLVYTASVQNRLPSNSGCSSLCYFCPQRRFEDTVNMCNEFGWPAVKANPPTPDDGPWVLNGFRFCSDLTWWKDPPCLMGKSTISTGPFSIAILTWGCMKPHPVEIRISLRSLSFSQEASNGRRSLEMVKGAPEQAFCWEWKGMETNANMFKNGPCPSSRNFGEICYLFVIVH